MSAKLTSKLRSYAKIIGKYTGKSASPKKVTRPDNMDDLRKIKVRASEITVLIAYVLIGIFLTDTQTGL